MYTCFFFICAQLLRQVPSQVGFQTTIIILGNHIVMYVHATRYIPNDTCMVADELTIRMCCFVIPLLVMYILYHYFCRCIHDRNSAKVSLFLEEPTPCSYILTVSLIHFIPNTKYMQWWKPQFIGTAQLFASWIEALLWSGLTFSVVSDVPNLTYNWFDCAHLLVNAHAQL